MNICSISECNQPLKARGYCSKHWKRARNGRDLTAKSIFEKTDEERFWEKVDRRGDNECWPWKGSIRGKGYGGAWFKKKKESAHRIAWLIIRGPIPEVLNADYRGTCLLHTCDNPSCVNPNHLVPGTNLQNIKDKVAKGRDNGTRKLFCKHGHPRTSENIYTDKRGLRHCRVCQRLKDQLRRNNKAKRLEIV